ncbi:MAG: hypothetical protein P4L71_04260 [Acetobacteraceae bacterium]|nr:hypothetical protein [Acetobacteraceae bacterium]
MPTADATAMKTFRGGAGGAEHFITVQASAGGTFAEQVAQVEQRYARAQAALGLQPDSAIFRRIFLSDAPNQAAHIEATRLFDDPDSGPVAVSIVQQPPLPDAKLALLAYHVDGNGPVTKQRLSPNQMIVRKHGNRHLWSTGLCTGAVREPTSTVGQTRAVFEALTGALASHRATLRDHCVRTWIYVKDVDVFYQDVVTSRTAFFEQHGLTRDTHYLASTGIEGACAHRYDTVLMDAYSNLDLVPEQVSYLNDFKRLCATKDYGVTFERGTRIGYADRAQHFISGTASIDVAGHVVHPGDVLRQLDRALDNVAGLLESGAAALGDMQYLLVYLRDPSELTRVEPRLRERCPNVPLVFLRGAVCRPDWLIEVEGVAVTSSNAPNLPNF